MKFNHGTEWQFGEEHPIGAALLGSKEGQPPSIRECPLSLLNPCEGAPGTTIKNQDVAFLRA
jgi:hypothetical protein